jgi:hypothetical protein
MAVSVAQPSFLTGTVRLTHSLRLMMPLPLPPEAVSLIATVLASSLEAPVMAKFWVLVAALITVTGADTGAEVAQLRSGSAAVAV